MDIKQIIHRIIGIALFSLVALAVMHFTGLGEGLGPIEQVIMFGVGVFVFCACLSLFFGALYLVYSVIRHIVEFLKYGFSGYDRDGYDRNGYDRKGYTRKGYNKYGYDSKGYNTMGFNKQGYSIDGYDREGYNKKGFNRDGYNRFGYDKYGFNTQGFNRSCYDISGYNAEGFNALGFDREGFNLEGYNRFGFDREGLNRAGFDRNGFDADGYNCQGFNKDGFDRHGVDSRGRDQSGYYRWFDSFRIDENTYGNLNDTECVKYLLNRGIHQLVHYTPLENLRYIIKNGIVPRANIKNKAYLPDAERRDQHLDCSSFSITSPNYQLFYRKRMEMRIPFVVLSIDVHVLNALQDYDVAYFPDNAARGKFVGHFSEYTGVHALTKLFADQMNYYDVTYDRCQHNLPTEYPTNPQAEVLIRGTIPPEYIKAVLVENADVMRLIADTDYGRNIKIELCPDAFGPRADSKSWTAIYAYL